MKLTQEENFFPNLDLILPQIKKIPLYNPIEYEKLEKQKGNWPGLRSQHLTVSCPLLHELILNLILRKKLFEKGKWEIDTFLHMRLQEHGIQDWIHTDPCEFAGLIYISDTNLSSGTKLYDEDENVVNDIKFVKNRYVMYSGRYKHMGYGHHGSSIEDGRLTLNMFLKRMNDGA